MDCGELHEADEADEAFDCLVFAGGDAAKLRRKAHHALDAVGPGVADPVQRARLLALGFPRIDRVCLDTCQFGSGHLRAILAIKQTKHGTQTQRRLQKGCGAHRADCTIVRQSTRSIDERGCRKVSADLGVGLSTLNKWVNAFSE
jgi:hypothetical protein